MTNSSDLWVLEWSQRTNNLHVQQLERTLSFNVRLYADNKQTVNDYRVLHVGTSKECYDAADAVRNTIAERERHLRELA